MKVIIDMSSPRAKSTFNKQKKNKTENKKEEALFLTAEEIFSQILRKEFLQHLLYKTSERRLKRIINSKVIINITTQADSGSYIGCKS